MIWCYDIGVNVRDLRWTKAKHSVESFMSDSSAAIRRV